MCTTAPSLWIIDSMNVQSNTRSPWPLHTASTSHTVVVIRAHTEIRSDSTLHTAVNVVVLERE